MFVLNIHLVQKLTKCFCSILLNAYDTPTERAEWVTSDWANSSIGSGVRVMWASKMGVYIYTQRR